MKKLRHYKHQIMFILIIKLALFSGIWLLFFKNPLKINNYKVYQQIFLKNQR
jgi:hypothetical protein